ncbi:MAG: hypothetical protein WBB28_02020 [Crinalium sp.]
MKAEHLDALSEFSPVSSAYLFVEYAMITLALQNIPSQGVEELLGKYCLRPGFNAFQWKDNKRLFVVTFPENGEHFENASELEEDLKRLGLDTVVENRTSRMH